MADDKGGVAREQEGKAREKQKRGEWRGPSDKRIEQEKRERPEQIPYPGEPAGGE